MVIGTAVRTTVVVTVALVGEEIWDTIGAHVGRRATRISKKGETPFHPGPVNSSFWYSFLSFRCRFLRLLLTSVPPSCGMERCQRPVPKVPWNEAPLQKERSDLPSRAFFLRYARGRDPLW